MVGMREGGREGSGVEEGMSGRGEGGRVEG